MRARELKFGTKLDYVCRFQECLMKLNVELSNANETAIIWHTTGQHNHNETNKPQIGINPNTKAQVDNPLYKPGIIVPTRMQITNYLTHTLKPRIKIGTSKFSYGDLAKWIDKNSSVPDNEDMTFVIGSFVDVNLLVPKASTIRLSLSTKRLIANCMKNDHLCAGATYKLTWHSKLLSIVFILI